MRIIACSIALIAVFAAAPAARANPFVGIRGGFYDDPDALFLGMHLAIYDFAGVPNFHLEPSLELGIDLEDNIDYFTMRGSGTLSYRFPVGRQVTVYPLGGLSLIHIEVDEGGDDSELSIHLGGGVGIGQFSIELWINTDYPDLNLTFAYTF